MRTIVTLSALTLIVAACSSGERKDSALSNDLQQDLALATTSVALPASPANANFALETAPPSAPEPATKLRRSPGRRAIHSEVRTVAAAPDPTPAPTEEMSIPVSQTPSTAESTGDPHATVEGVPLPRPTAIPVSLPASGPGPEVIVQDGRTGGVLGGIGAVIRGGGVDGDNCEIHDRRGRRRPVYVPMGGGYAGGRIGDLIASRGGSGGRSGLPRY